MLIKANKDAFDSIGKPNERQLPEDAGTTKLSFMERLENGLGDRKTESKQQDIQLGEGKRIQFKPASKTSKRPSVKRSSAHMLGVDLTEELVHRLKKRNKLKQLDNTLLSETIKSLKPPESLPSEPEPAPPQKPNLEETDNDVNYDDIFAKARKRNKVKIFSEDRQLLNNNAYRVQRKKWLQQERNNIRNDPQYKEHMLLTAKRRFRARQKKTTSKRHFVKKRGQQDYESMRLNKWY